MGDKGDEHWYYPKYGQYNNDFLHYTTHFHDGVKKTATYHPGYYSPITIKNRFSEFSGQYENSDVEDHSYRDSDVDDQISEYSPWPTLLSDMYG